LEFLDIYTNAKKGPRIKRQVYPILELSPLQGSGESFKLE